MKSEIRISKSETNSKSKIRKSQTRSFRDCFFEFRICFGFRNSDFVRCRLPASRPPEDLPYIVDINPGQREFRLWRDLGWTQRGHDPLIASGTARQRQILGIDIGNFSGRGRSGYVHRALAVVLEADLPASA